jgi:ArsR family transcriptional regulator
MAHVVTARPRARAAARSFHALADPTRLHILDLLRGGERCVCELQEALGTSQSLLSFHLKTLKDAGLLADRRQGRWVYYRLRPAGLTEAERTLSRLARA